MDSFRAIDYHRKGCRKINGDFISGDIMEDSRERQQTIIGYSVDVYVTLLIISLFAYMSFRLLAPFVSILIWATILAVALYPLWVWLTGKFGGRSALASTLIAVVGLAVLVTPTVLAVDSIIDTLGNAAAKLSGDQFHLPPPKESIKDWPLIGEQAYEFWTKAHGNLQDTIHQFLPQIRDVATSLLGASAGLIVGVLQFALSIIFAAVFLSFSAPLTTSTRRIARRVGSERGHQMVDMAGATIRNVSRGVLGVAVIQGGLAAIGIFAMGLPFAGVLAAVTLMACIVQMPPLAILPLIIYAWTGETSAATIIFTVYMLLVMFLDNVLKPILMARGLTTPMVVILIGVIGGTLTSGMLGLFIGPVILALFYEMVRVWLASMTPEEAPAVTTAGGDG